MPTNLYGPGDNYHSTNSHVVPSLIKRFYDAKNLNKREVVCWGSGIPRREFLHVDDLAEAILFTLKYWDPSSKNAPLTKKGSPLLHLNVGTGVDITIKKLQKLLVTKEKLFGIAPNQMALHKKF